MYEASEVIAIGEAHDLIQGIKPFKLNSLDDAFELNRDYPVGDIDETDE